MKNKLEAAAKKAGAETKADVGVFLVGAALGGIADATINLFVFADPMVIAPITGAAFLGIKHIFSSGESEQKNDAAEQSTSVNYESLQLHVDALNANLKTREAKALDLFIKDCKSKDVTAEDCFAAYKRAG